MGPALHSHCRFRDGDPYARRLWRWKKPHRYHRNDAQCHASPVFVKICISSVYFSKVNFSWVCYLNVYISKVIITTTMRNAICLMCFSKCIFQRVFKKKDTASLSYKCKSNAMCLRCIFKVYFSKCIFDKCICICYLCGWRQCYQVLSAASPSFTLFMRLHWLNKEYLTKAESPRYNKDLKSLDFCQIDGNVVMKWKSPHLL